MENRPKKAICFISMRLFIGSSRTPAPIDNFTKSFNQTTLASENVKNMTNETASTAAVTEPTTEQVVSKIAELQEQFKSAWSDMAKQEPGTKEAETAMNNVRKIQLAIDAEKAFLRKAEAYAKIQEQRNSRVKMVEDLLSAHNENLAVQADKKAPIDAKNEAYAKFNEVKEAIVNELCARFSVPAKPSSSASGNDKPAAPKGSVSTQIVERFLFHRNAGLNDTDAIKAVIGEGFSRGTTGAAVLAWQRANGEKP